MMLRFTLILLLSAFCFAACSTFNNRRYTKGFYHDFSSKGKPKATGATKDSVTALQNHESKKPAIPIDEPLTTSFNRQSLKSAIQHSDPSSTLKFIKKNSEIFQKKLGGEKKSSFKPLFLKKKFGPAKADDGSIGTFLLYILAFVLAIAIIILAFYFAPSVVVPTAATGKFFEVLVLIICTILSALCIAIYRLISNFIDFIRRTKTGRGKFYS